jgi:hypothetical protein
VTGEDGLDWHETNAEVLTGISERCNQRKHDQCAGFGQVSAQEGANYLLRLRLT